MLPGEDAFPGTALAASHTTLLVFFFFFAPPHLVMVGPFASFWVRTPLVLNHQQISLLFEIVGPVG